MSQKESASLFQVEKCVSKIPYILKMPTLKLDWSRIGIISCSKWENKSRNITPAMHSFNWRNQNYYVVNVRFGTCSKKKARADDEARGDGAHDDECNLSQFRWHTAAAMKNALVNSSVGSRGLAAFERDVWVFGRSSQSFVILDLLPADTSLSLLPCISHFGVCAKNKLLWKKNHFQNDTHATCDTYTVTLIGAITILGEKKSGKKETYYWDIFACMFYTNKERLRWPDRRDDWKMKTINY